MNCTGVDDGYAILLYYAPALMLNLQSSIPIPTNKDDNNNNNTLKPPLSEEGLKVGFTLIAKFYTMARASISERKGKLWKSILPNIK